MQPLLPLVLWSMAVLVALHPKSMEVIIALGADGEVRLELAAGTAVLAPTSGRCHLTARGRCLRLVVVVGTRWFARAGGHMTEHHEILAKEEMAEDVRGNNAPGDTDDDAKMEPEMVRSQAAGRGPDASAELLWDEPDVEAPAGAALARIVVAAGDPRELTGAGEEEPGKEGPPRAQVVVPMDNDEVECTGSQAAPTPPTHLPAPLPAAAHGVRGDAHRHLRPRETCSAAARNFRGEVVALRWACPASTSNSSATVESLGMYSSSAAATSTAPRSCTYTSSPASTAACGDSGRGGKAQGAAHLQPPCSHLRPPPARP